MANNRLPNPEPRHACWRGWRLLVGLLTGTIALTNGAVATEAPASSPPPPTVDSAVSHVPDGPKNSSSLASIRAWQVQVSATPMGWPWSSPPRHSVKLRDAGPAQTLYCVGGGARSGEYRLFGHHRGRVRVLSGIIEQAHHPVYRLRQQVAGWHDFQTYLPNWGSGGHEVTAITYRWQGNVYRPIQFQSGRWCDFPYFHQTSPECRANQPNSPAAITPDS